MVAAARQALKHSPVASDWILGVLLCLVGSTVTALGLVLQKYSHERNAFAAVPRIFYRQPWWLFGFSVFMSAQVLNLVAMGMAPQVLLSCLSAWSLIFNAIFAWVIVGESLQRREVATMVGAVAGVMVVIEGTPAPGEPLRGDLEAMRDSFASFHFAVMCGGVAVAMCFLFIMTQLLPGLVAVVWATLSAVFSGFSVMLFRCVSLLLIDPVRSGGPKATSPWLRPGPYAITLAALLVGVAQVHTMNLGLRAGEALVVVPVYYSLGMLAQILTGAVFFSELQNFADAGECARFWGGTLFLLACIITLTQSKISAEAELDRSLEGMGERTALLEGWRASSFDSEGVEVRTPGWRVGKLRGRSRSAQNMFVSRESSGPCVSGSYDPEAYVESFGEEPRLYTVSLVGAMGIA